MKKTFTKFLAALMLLAIFTPSFTAMGQTTTTYTFSSKDWEASPANWTSGQAGAGFSNNGIQVTTAATGAYGTSPGSFTNVTKIVCTYNTNKSKGAGSIVAQIGSNTATTNSVGYSGSANGTTANFTTTFNYNTPQSGNVKLTVNTTTNSIYLVSVAITTSSTPVCSDPTFSHTTDTYYGPQNVTISCATSGAEIHYTMGNNPADPTASSALYNGPIAVTETTTIKAIAIKSGMSNSSVASTTLTIQPTVFNQDWEGAMNGWTFVNITGDQVWNVSSYSGNHYAKMSGYASGNNANEDWCISPAFDLGDYTNPYLTFTSARSSHNGNELEVYFSNNYDGTNVSSATWTQLTCTLPAQPSSGYTDFTSSGNIDLSSYSGSSCYIGFKYTSTTSAAVTWELDDIVLASQTTTPTITLTPSSIDAGSNNPTGAQISKTFTVSQSNLTAGITLSTTLGSLSTSSVAQGAGDTEITWTYTPNATGNFSATITATSTGADPQTLTISGSAVDPIVGDCYELVTSAPQDWSGAYIITGTNSGNYYALTGVSSNLGTTAAVSVVGDKIESTATTDSYRVVVEATTNGYSLYLEEIGYLRYSGSDNRLFADESFTASTCEWTFAINNNLVTLTNVDNNTRVLQFNYNSGNPRFACYTSNQVKLNLFKYTGTIVLPPVINASNPETLAYNATSGEIEYTIDNPLIGASLDATTAASWISNVNVTSDKVTFTCTANGSAEDRTATFTLSYEGAANKTVTVTQAAYIAPPVTATYKLAKSIVSGKQYIIVGENDDNYYAMGYNKGNNRHAVAISVNGDFATATIAATQTDAHEFTITSLATTGYYSIQDATSSGYLYAAASGNNYLKTENLLDEDGKGDWAITFAVEGYVGVVARNTDVRNVMRFNYNSGTPLFSCYAPDSSTGTTFYLYEKVYTIDIAGHGGNAGSYYLITSPLNSATSATTVENLIDTNLPDFDLYKFNQSAEKEWVNWKNNGNLNGFNLVAGTGYLYANANDVTLVFDGTLYSGDGTFGLTYDSQAPNFAGWNLIGNPYTTTATIDKASFYRMNSIGTDVEIVTGGTVNPMEGIFVLATTTGQSVTFTQGGAKRAENAQVSLNIVNSRGNVIDRAIVSFDENGNMPKFMIDETNTKIYIPQSEGNYAIVSSNGQGTMPVNFKAKEIGQYTISVETEGIDLSYLHLIDRLTGDDINLLLDSKYSFIASNSDMESRFILSFGENGINANNETFAFQNGSDIIVNGEGELQIFDVMGRMVKNTTINGVETIAIPQGVYIFRLNENIQKIVVR